MTIIDSSYWKLFFRELQLFKKNEKTNMWKKGFKILKNNENWQLLQCNTQMRTDYITKHTINKFDFEIKSKRKSVLWDNEKNISDITA
jgi:hypothetical protein